MQILPSTSPAMNLSQDNSLSSKHGRSLTTKSGLKFNVWPTELDDIAALSAFFDGVSENDIRFRFISPMRNISETVLNIILDIDRLQHESYLAFDPVRGIVIANAMITVSADPTVVELALAVHSAYQTRDISRTFLEYLLDESRQKGFSKLRSMECSDRFDVIDLAADMGFTVKVVPGDPETFLLEKRLA